MQTARKREQRVRRQRRGRKKISGVAERPRLSVYRSNRHIYAQLVDDASGRTLASASTMEADGMGTDGDKKARAKAVGELIAKRAREAGIEAAVFDRGGRMYQGRVASLADGAREGGLRI